jgi:hypothetical protein
MSLANGPGRASRVSGIRVSLSVLGIPVDVRSAKPQALLGRKAEADENQFLTLPISGKLDANGVACSPRARLPRHFVRRSRRTTGGGGASSAGSSNAISAIPAARPTTRPARSMQAIRYLDLGTHMPLHACRYPEASVVQHRFLGSPGRDRTLADLCSAGRQKGIVSRPADCSTPAD